jgi:uncharacterized protein YjdB
MIFRKIHTPLLVLLTACSNNNPPTPSAPKAPKEVQLSQPDYVIGLKSTRKLSATVIYDDLSRDGNVVWSSSDDRIVTIDTSAGVVTGAGEGQATVVARAVNNPQVRALCLVTVKAGAVQDLFVSIDPASASMAPGATLQLNASVRDSNGEVTPNVTWSSSNNAVLVVNQTGLVTAVGKGDATVMATSQRDFSRRGVCDITVR